MDQTMNEITVFSSRRKVVNEVELLTAAGRPFQACGAATENARSPRVDRRVVGTSSVGAAAERSRRRASMSVVLCRLSGIYDGAVPRRQRNKRTHSKLDSLRDPQPVELAEQWYYVCTSSGRKKTNEQQRSRRTANDLNGFRQPQSEQHCSSPVC